MCSIILCMNTWKSCLQHNSPVLTKLQGGSVAFRHIWTAAPVHATASSPSHTIERNGSKIRWLILLLRYRFAYFRASFFYGLDYPPLIWPVSWKVRACPRSLHNSAATSITNTRFNSAQGLGRSEVFAKIHFLI